LELVFGIVSKTLIGSLYITPETLPLEAVVAVG
jgi:hypothetical protein